MAIVRGRTNRDDRPTVWDDATPDARALPVLSTNLDGSVADMEGKSSLGQILPQDGYFQWTKAADSALGSPSSGEWLRDNTPTTPNDPSLTTLRLHKTDGEGNDREDALEQLEIGDSVYIRKLGDPSIFERYSLNGNASDGGPDVELPIVIYSRSDTLIQTGDECEILLVFDKELSVSLASGTTISLVGNGLFEGSALPFGTYRPLLVAGRDTSGGDGDSRIIGVNTLGHVLISGPDANGTAITQDPVLVGGADASGDIQRLRTAPDGDVRVHAHTDLTSLVDGVSDASVRLAVAEDDATFYPTLVWPFGYNGSTWDRQRHRFDDLDTGGGTDEVPVMGLALPGAGGHAVGGTASNPVRIDPTGTTRQPVDPISGQSGVSADSGASDATTQRTILATDDPLVTSTGGQSDAVVAAGATGSIQAKLRRLTTDLDAALTRLDAVGQGDQFTYAGTAYSKLFATLDVATDPDEIVAAPGASTKIVVLGLFASNTGTDPLTFHLEDDAAAITAQIQLNGNGGGGYTPLLAECAENDALNVVTDAGTATDLSLMAVYIEAST